MQEFTGVLKNLQERVTVITSVMEAKEPLTAVMETLQELTERVTVVTSLMEATEPLTAVMEALQEFTDILTASLEPLTVPLELMNISLKAPQEPPATAESVLLSILCRCTWARWAS